MNKSKRFVDLVVIGSKNEPELKAFAKYSPLIVKDQEGNVVFAGLKQPSMNMTVISEEGVSDVYEIRERFGIDNEDTTLELSVISGHNFYINNYTDEETVNLKGKHEEVDSLCKEFFGLNVSGLINKLPKPVVELSDNVTVDHEVLAQFADIGFKQRGWAENTMLDYQNMSGGGVYSHALEHIGDLIHRCTHMIHHGNPCKGEMVEKIDKMLVRLESDYPFLKEHQENQERSHAFKVDKCGETRTFEQYQNDLLDIADKYGKYHAELPAYNNLHLACKRATVSLANLDIPVTVMSLKQIDDILKNNYIEKAASHKLDSNGELIDITHTDKYLSKKLGLTQLKTKDSSLVI